MQRNHSSPFHLYKALATNEKKKKRQDSELLLNLSI